MVQSNFQQIINFWFGDLNWPHYGQPRQEWFIKTQKFDEEIRTLLLADYQEAARGELDHWQNNSQSCLALIVLLDQVPRNLFRNQPQMFATDEKALSIAKYAVNHGYDQQLLPVQRWFIYLPFEHSENLMDQHQSMELFQKLSNDPNSASAIDYAMRHFEIIQRFGRFPHRNHILGRESTPEELEFLQQPGSSF